MKLTSTAVQNNKPSDKHTTIPGSFVINYIRFIITFLFAIAFTVYCLRGFTVICGIYILMDFFYKILVEIDCDVLDQTNNCKCI